MKILAIGDIVGTKSVDYLADRLFRVKGELGVDMVIANGKSPDVLYRIVDGEAVGTRFAAREVRV